MLLAPATDNMDIPEAAFSEPVQVWMEIAFDAAHRIVVWGLVIAMLRH